MNYRKMVGYYYTAAGRIEDGLWLAWLGYLNEDENASDPIAVDYLCLLLLVILWLFFI